MKTITLACATLAFLAATPAIGAEADFPPWNIAGNDWICIAQCEPGYGGKPTEVIQNGDKFIFVNETGRRSEAEWKGGGQISFSGCDNAAILSADLKRLDFIFGSVWVR
jgi:hypothetical protein